MIDVFIYSYKGKDLLNFVKHIIDNTNSKIHVTLLDQSPLNKSKVFEEIDNVSYSFIRWFSLNSPCSYKKDFIQSSNSKYTLLITDDTVLSKSWDIDAIKFLEEHENAVISGRGSGKLLHSSNFFIKREALESSEYIVSNYIDRNFIFCDTGILKDIEYPTNFKYYGEEEMLSLKLFCSGIDVYATPFSMFDDLNVRTLENTLKHFSLFHNYNIFVERLKQNTPMKYKQRSVDDFIKFHNLDINKIHKLPYEINDIMYDSENFKFNETENRIKRFLAGPKAIY